MRELFGCGIQRLVVWCIYVFFFFFGKLPNTTRSIFYSKSPCSNIFFTNSFIFQLCLRVIKTLIG